VRFSTRGVQKHHKKLFGKIHVKNFWAKKLRKKKLFSFHLFPWRFWPFLNKGSSKTPQKLFGESPCQKLLAEKVEKKNFFPVVFSHRFFYRVFGRFSA
jgi:hypothetical protein